MEFVFGTLATDELKLVHHRVVRRGIQHGFNISPRDPRPGQTVILHVTTGPELDVDTVACYYTNDGSIPEGSRGVASNGIALEFVEQEIVWDTIRWGYVRQWQVTLPAQDEGTLVRYRISAWNSTNEAIEEIRADYPEFKATTERAAGAFFRGLDVPDDLPPSMSQDDVFSYVVDTYHAPGWAKQAIIYQIFVDRFYPGDGKTWNETEKLSDFYGGTLWGVIDKLDYIEELGVNCIWLTPIFVSPTHHGYDTVDYMNVDERYGGNGALKALVDAAHARGIRVLLDLVCNHISNENPYFLDALNDENSPYRDWFIFDDSEEWGYKTFFSVETMPFLNLRNEAAKNWMIDIARYWIREFDVDGYRLDHANGPGQAFWTEFRAACREEKVDSLVFGEVVEAPNILRSYEGRLDGLLDFMMEDALRKTFAFGTMTEREFEMFVNAQSRYFNSDFIMPTFLDNHDMDRFLFAAKGDKKALIRAATVQMTLSQPPIIYYGTEVGLTQTEGAHGGLGLEASRLPMLWGEAQDKELLATYKQLIADRKVRP